MAVEHEDEVRVKIGDTYIWTDRATPVAIADQSSSRDLRIMRALLEESLSRINEAMELANNAERGGEWLT